MCCQFLQFLLWYKIVYFIDFCLLDSNLKWLKAQNKLCLLLGGDVEENWNYINRIWLKIESRSLSTKQSLLGNGKEKTNSTFFINFILNIYLSESFNNQSKSISAELIFQLNKDFNEVFFHYLVAACQFNLTWHH